MSMLLPALPTTPGEVFSVRYGSCRICMFIFMHSIYSRLGYKFISYTDEDENEIWKYIFLQTSLNLQERTYIVSFGILYAYSVYFWNSP